MSGIRPATRHRLPGGLFTGLMLVICGVPAFTWEDELPRDQMLLSQIKQQMRRNLSRIPNYTCLETITRGQHASERLVISVPGKAVPFRRIDVVRLEIAEVGLNELFARPGEHNFEKREMAELVSGGLIGNGLFSLFAHNIFVSNVAQYDFRGEQVIDGRTLLHFDFRVPQLMSGFKFTAGRSQAILGYHGSFWADPKTFDAVRLEIVADDIPPDLGIIASTDRVDYAPVLIGSSKALLAQSAEMTVTEQNGAESRNQISFTHCREYGVQTVLKFEDLTEADSGSTGGGTNFVDLPSGLQLTLRLDTPINSDTAQVGDLLSATVDVEARHRGKVVVPKDAVVTGRLRRMEKHKEGWPYVLAGMEFTSIEFEGKQARFFAELDKIILPPGSEGTKRVQARDLPGVGMVSVLGNHLGLPKGMHMVWKTISYQQSAEIAK